MNEIDIIKELFSQIKKSDRDKFFKKVAKKFNVEKSTIRSNWFSKLKVPDKYKIRKRLIKYMKKYIMKKR